MKEKRSDGRSGTAARPRRAGGGSWSGKAVRAPLLALLLVTAPGLLDAGPPDPFSPATGAPAAPAGAVAPAASPALRTVQAPSAVAAQDTAAGPDTVRVAGEPADVPPGFPDQNLQDHCAAAGIEILSPLYAATRDGSGSTIPTQQQRGALQ